MLPAKQLLREIAKSLRTVIAPAIAEPYPKSQAHMAAVILDFLSHQVEERGDVRDRKQEALDELFANLAQRGAMQPIIAGIPATDAGLCQLIERLYSLEQAPDHELVEAHRLVRLTIRRLLDQDLKMVGKAEA